MKPLRYLVLFAILIVSCSSAPSGEAIQTAIAQTQKAQSTKDLPPKPSATHVSTHTPIPKLTPTPISGWNKFEASGIEIWLPESYEGGDLENDTEVVINRMKALGPEFEQMANNIEKNPSMVKLIAVDTNIGDTGFVTNINIGREQIL